MTTNRQGAALHELTAPVFSHLSSFLDPEDIKSLNALCRATHLTLNNKLFRINLLTKLLHNLSHSPARVF
jgi:hypothetical protein